MPLKFDNSKLKNRPSGWTRFRTAASGPRVALAFGFVLLLIALVLLISFVSFFFVGKDDYSILYADGGQLEHRGEVVNGLGLMGAWLSKILIDGTIGLAAFGFVYLLTVFGIRLCARNDWSRRMANIWVLLAAIPILVWCMLLFATIQELPAFGSFFHWGGVWGQALYLWMASYIHPLGVILTLAATLVIFIICADAHVIDHCAALYERVFHRKKKEEEAIEKPLENQENLEPTAAPEPVLQDDVKIEIMDNMPAEEEPTEDVESPETIQTTQTLEPAEGVSMDVEVKEEEAVSDDPEYILKTQGPYDPRAELSQYQFPSLSLLKVYDNETKPVVDAAEQQANANRIVSTLRNYGVEIDSIKATVGPTVTLYEVVPKAGTRVGTIQRLENDIMLALAAEGIRIIAPMPGKGTVGIEVPNEKPQIVSMHSVLASKRFSEEQKMHLPVAIGRTITNEIFMFDLAKTPHLLVAGATGQGKSVGLNAIITSLLYKKHPAELKFVLVDPKMVEFTIYKPLLRHYMAAMPDQEDEDIIITDCQKVINTLNSLVIEMEDRYSLLSDAACRNLEDYNDKFVQRQLNPAKDVENRVTHKILHHHFMPYLVIVIDEYGDFIMQAGKEVEHPIQRITQKARAVGMHMILATQRPDVKIVTGTIKANIPTRIAFRTQSVVDSRTVLDATGANQLIGKGDMLYSAGGNLTRIQCAFVDTPEIERIVGHIHDQQHYLEPYQLPEYVPEGADDQPMAGEVDLKRLDPMFAEVARYVVAKQEGSTSRLQRAFEIGYNRAGKLSDQLEAAGVVGPNKGPKGRDVLIQDPESLENLLQQLGA